MTKFVDHYKILKIAETATNDEIYTQFQNIRNKLLINKRIPAAQLAAKLQVLDNAAIILLNELTRSSFDRELLDAAIEESKSPKKDINLIDYSKYRIGRKVKWQDLIADFNPANIGSNLTNFLDRTLYLPKRKIQLPMLVALLATPSSMCDIVPLVFCYGESGTGKSIIGKVAGYLWGITPLLSSSTYAGIRNKIKASRWTTVGGETLERNIVLVWNDIKESHLNDNNLVAMLKGGYDRLESTIEMSNVEKDGTNQVFDIFGIKIFSSIDPIFACPQHSELIRRMIIFHSEKPNNLQKLKPLSEIDFTGFGDISRAWDNPELCQKFADCDLRPYLLADPSNIPVDRIDTICDVLRTGVTIGVWKSELAAVAAFIEFEEFNRNLKSDYGNLPKLLLQKLIERTTAFRITPKTIKIYFKTLEQEGAIESVPKQPEIAKLMAQFGWKFNLRLETYERISI